MRRKMYSSFDVNTLKGGDAWQLFFLKKKIVVVVAKRFSQNSVFLDAIRRGIDLFFLVFKKYKDNKMLKI